MNGATPGGARQGILSLALKDKAALYSAYMPFIRHGGIFVATPKRYFLGDEVFLLVTLPDSNERLPVAGKVVWVTPVGAQGNRPAGIGIQFADNAEGEAVRGKIEAVLAKLGADLEALRGQFAEKLFTERLAKLPEAIRDDIRAALAVEPAKRNEVQKYLAEKFQKELRPDKAALPKILTETYLEYRIKATALDTALAAEQGKRRTFPEIRALYDLPPRDRLWRSGRRLCGAQLQIVGGGHLGGPANRFRAGEIRREGPHART